MAPHSAHTEILLKYQVQLHQLTPNAIAQLSKYFWAVLSFGGEPSSDGFAKRYELHHQPKKVIVDSFKKFQQFGVSNFHAWRGSKAGLTLAIKNKWSTRWIGTSGQPGGQELGFTTRYPCTLANKEGNLSMLFIHT
jgi:hypothetical protein